MNDVELPDQVSKVIFWVRLCDEDLCAFQAQPGGPFLCRICDGILDPVVCESNGNIEAYECCCGVWMTAMEAYEDIAKFKRLLEEL
jgi:hypothetical protein